LLGTLLIDTFTPCERFRTYDERIGGRVLRRRPHLVVQGVQAPSHRLEALKRLMNGLEAIVEGLHVRSFGRRHPIAGDVNLQVKGRTEAGAQKIEMPVVQPVEGATDEAPLEPRRVHWWEGCLSVLMGIGVAR
jgi:hypothetical protein